MMGYQDPKIDGWISWMELPWLYETAKRMESIVEIGSWLGKSTHALLSGCPGTVTAVDTFRGSPSRIDTTHALAKTEDIHALFLHNVGYLPNLRVLRMESLEAAPLFPDRSVDMVWIDGDHEYQSVLADILAWRPKARRLLCGHDEGMEGVRRALRNAGVEYHVEGPSPPFWIWSCWL